MTKITIDVADTPELLAQGLMWVKEMPQNHGMLFKFQNQIQPSFWGKNTYLPLDIAFIKNNKIIDIKNIVPLSTRSVAANGICTMALETHAGFFHENNIKIGHEIEINDKEVIFKRA